VKTSHYVLIGLAAVVGYLAYRRYAQGKAPLLPFAGGIL
jgi:hypothetical protein